MWHYAATNRLEQVRAAALDTDGSLQVLMEAGTGTAAALYRIGTDGALAWRKEVCVGTERADMPTMTLLRNGDTALVCADNAGARFLRVDRSGATRAEATLPTVNARPIATRADGTVQVRGSRIAGSLQSELYAVDADGKVVDSPGATPSAGRGQTLAAQRLDANGASYLFAHPIYTDDTDAMTLTKVGANGAPAWRRTVAGNWYNVRMTAGGGRLCIGGKVVGNPTGPTNEIRCYDDADGAERWAKSLPATNGGEASKAWPPPGPPDVDDYQVLDDGSLITVQGDATTHAFIRFDTNGTQVARVVGAGGIASASLHGAGWATLSLRKTDGVPALLRYDRQGNAKAIGASANALGAFELADGSTAADGGVHAIAREAASPSTGGRELWSIRADGTIAWKRAYRSTYAKAAIVRSANAAYLVERENDRGASEPESVRVQAFAPGDGAPLATIDEALVLPGGGGAFALSASGGVAALATGQRERLRIARYDAVTGAPLDERYAACGDFCGRVEALSLDANGNARVALNVADRAVGATVGVFAQADVGTDAPRIRIDQPGIAGAWWAPYANGEGFALDYLPDSRTFFMPWFTFAREGGNAARQQRWYVVQGAIAPNATSAELAITLTDPGEFDREPPRQARRVGTAFVRFTDCDNGTLRYAFDADVNGGAHGTITLSRLGAAVADCALADGTTRPGAGLAPPANGFDARLSGSWFEPATAGQGLQFVVQPGGVFFAPWFTFRVAYTGFIPLPFEPRWFTLQGSLASARDGVVELPIVRTIGGAFDSVPTNNMFAVGTAKLTILACDRATLDYRFDNTEEAADMFARAGTIDLVKAGGCAR
ncbi:hypothetical protein [Tahibacter soli]|uniref:Uncharacterized protein n=1 Tax=Tahibacter soli TaxID=2983605 RepID=A0A9X3YFM6_9GAMM|nr:hypothetical protein [Tahibacter soli]MDC8011046.1 hypothetical protein [Tahibacter soli]